MTRFYLVLIGVLFTFTIAYGQLEEVNHWETIFYSDTTFNYWVSNQGEPDANWRSIDYDVSNWLEGKGGFGYGDSDDQTIIDPCISVFFRRDFEIFDTSAIKSMILAVDYDDAFVAYINGVEIARSNGLNEDFPSYDTFSETQHEAEMYSGGTPQQFIVEKEVLNILLKPGLNSITVQVHNNVINSSDMSSNVFLFAGLSMNETKYLPLTDWFITPVFIEPAQEPLWMSLFKPREITDGKYLQSENVFDTYSISTINITLSDADYTKLMTNYDDNAYLTGTMNYKSSLIEDTIVSNVGIRLRGKAAMTDSKKKSFKISFEEFGNDDRDFYGLDKINLNCDFQDPNLLRTKICTELFRSVAIPAARIGYSKLYINNEYRGLFVNYENIDKDFLDSRFKEKDGNLYKCNNNSTMQYRSAEDYQNVTGWHEGELAYEKVTNDEMNDYSDLARFIKVLNNTPDSSFEKEIEKVFDVDEFLLMLATNVLAGAWDDYWCLSKNFYFYHSLYSDKFIHIPHDFDGSLGTDWFLGNVAYKNVYYWSPNSGRPMVEKLLARDKYRKKYTYYLQILCTWPFSIEALEPEIDRSANLIKNTLINDPYWPVDFGWIASDFDTSLDQAIPRGNVDFGLKEYIKLRRESALSQLEEFAPFIDFVANTIPVANTDIVVSAFVLGQRPVTSVKLIYKIDDATFERQMQDNGSFDALRNDFIYAASIPFIDKYSHIEYYISATDTNGNIARYPQEDWILCNTDYTAPKLYINEFLADNATALSDEYGEYDDWIELYNGEETELDLSGKYISDDITNPKKFRFNNLTISSKSHLILWADNAPEQGNNHVGFKLSKNGEEIGLYDTDVYQNELIDYIQFGLQDKDISYGRTTDGGSVWDYTDVAQDTTTINAKFATQLKYYPNPVISTLFVSSNTTIERIVLKGIDGKIIRSQNVQSPTADINFSTLIDGIYIVTVYGDSDFQTNIKIIKKSF